MIKLVDRLREGCPASNDVDCLKERCKAADVIERLKAELFTMRNVFHQQDAEIERLRAVVDAAREYISDHHNDSEQALFDALAALEVSDE